MAATKIEYIEEARKESEGVPFGKYLLLEKIAVGGMAEVFRAKQLGLEGFEKLVAIKRILPHLSDNEEFVKMFIDEGKVAAQLTHQNIAQVYDLGEHDGSHYLAMEYIHGRDLKTAMEVGRQKERPLTPYLCAVIASKLCAGLAYAHRKKDLHGTDLHIVHRDISPQNILISFEGEVKIIDFGIAKAATKVSVTRAGALKGKILYMSPEQAQGNPIDHRSDLFSLGTLLFEMLTGRRLFMAKTEHAILEKVRDAKVLPPSTFNRIVPPELDEIVLKCLQKDVEKRYQTATEIQRDLELFLLSASERSPANFDLAAYMKTLFGEGLDEDNLGQARTETIESAPPPAPPRRDDDPNRTRVSDHILRPTTGEREGRQPGENLGDSDLITNPALPIKPGRSKSPLAFFLTPSGIAFILVIVITLLIFLMKSAAPPEGTTPGRSAPPAAEESLPGGAP